MTSRRLVAALTLVVGLVAASPTLEAARRYSAERYDVRLSVEAGGSMVVTETIRFVFGPDQFTYVFRELPRQKIDGFTILAVEMDGVPFSPGKQAGRYDSKRTDNGRRRLTWHFAAVSDSSHEFTFVYRVDGAVQQEDTADILRWIALPRKHEYAIGCADIQVEYPDAASLVASPEFIPAAAKPAPAARPVHATRCGFEKDDDWMVTLRFAPGSIAATPPEWQRRSIQTWKTAPLFLGVAGLLFFGGMAGFVMFAMNHRSARPSDSHLRQTERPDGLPVALAGALAGTRGGISWANSIGTMLDLAHRGVLEIKTPEDANWLSRRDYVIVLRSRPHDLHEHERTLLDILFTTSKGQREKVAFSQLSRAFTSDGGWKRFGKAVTAELRREGLLDAERERSRSGATRAGLGLVIFAVVGLGASALFVDRIGVFVLTIPGALLVSGVTGIIVGQALTPLSDKGLERARRWKAYSRHLAAVSKGRKSDVPAGSLESLLPLAVAFGVALAWAKRLDKQGALGVPVWFRALARQDGRPNSGLFIEMLSMANTAGAHVTGGSGGAGGAGAAGGGSSGAG